MSRIVLAVLGSLILASSAGAGGRDDALQVGLAGLLVAPSASGGRAAPDYRFHGVPWPRGVIRYYNAAPSQEWAVWQAVTAWNRSGAKIRFVATSQRNAQLVIRHHPSVASCKRAEATLGYVPRARVLIYPRNDNSASCNRYAAARFLAHELGHVLGLKHEDGGCAAMNSSGSYQGGRFCQPGDAWEWRCQLLEQDDVRGVVAMYGGMVGPASRHSPMCPLYEPMAAPAALSATYDADQRGVILAFHRAADPRVPAYLAPSAAGSPRAYGFLPQSGACPSQAMSVDVPRYRWHKGELRFSRLVDQPAPGRYCYAVWSYDWLGRPSARPATAWVVIPPPRTP